LLKDIRSETVVIKTPIWEPYAFYKLITGQKDNARLNAGFLTENPKPGLTEKISIWIRGNLFIPDARKFWIKPSVKFLSEYLKNNPVDVIVSTGPPHSMHLIAMQIHDKLHIPWLADFRDPWTNIDYYKELMLTKAADAKHRKLEREVLEKADVVLSIGKTMNDEFKSMISAKNKFHVVTNGFDAEDMPSENIEPDPSFCIMHLGAINKARNPEKFWKTLSDKVKENNSLRKDLRIRLIGKTDIAVRKSIEQCGLNEFTVFTEYIAHGEVMKNLMQAQVLLLPLNDTHNSKGILTGKMFEYLAARRPVLCIGPVDGDAAEIISQAGAGYCINFGDEKRMSRCIDTLYDSYKKKSLHVSSQGLEKFSRKNLTGQLAELLNTLTIGNSQQKP
jgi:glycosyltransferase involved in cell wall biosynthesis